MKNRSHAQTSQKQAKILTAKSSSFLARFHAWENHEIIMIFWVVTNTDTAHLKAFRLHCYVHSSWTKISLEIELFPTSAHSDWSTRNPRPTCSKPPSIHLCNLIVFPELCSLVGNPQGYPWIVFVRRWRRTHSQTELILLFMPLRS